MSYNKFSVNLQLILSFISWFFKLFKANKHICKKIIYLLTQIHNSVWIMPDWPNNRMIFAQSLWTRCVCAKALSHVPLWPTYDQSSPPRPPPVHGISLMLNTGVWLPAPGIFLPRSQTVSSQLEKQTVSLLSPALQTVLNNSNTSKVSTNHLTLTNSVQFSRQMFQTIALNH